MAALELINTTLFNDNNLVSYWRFEGNSNDSKSSNNGSDTAITYNSGNGRFGQGPGFNGTSSTIAIASAANIRLTGDFTILSWVKPNDATPNLNMGVFVKGDNSADANLDYGLLVLNRKVRGVVDSGSASFAINGSTTMSDNTYHLIAVVYTSNSKIEVFLDGVSDGSNTVSPVVPQSTTHAAAIGSDGTSATRFFKDCIDDLAIFNRVLTAAEILAHFNGTNGASGGLDLTSKMW